MMLLMIILAVINTFHHQEADVLREQLTEAQQQLTECRETVDILKIQLARIDGKSEQGKCV